MPRKLPNGWVKTTLGEVCSRVNTIRPDEAPTSEFTYFDIGGIDNRRNRIAVTKTIVGRSAPSRARQAVRRFDILFSTVRTYLKNIACIEDDYPNPVASTGFTVIRPAEGVVPRFVLYQVLSDGFLGPLHSLQSGSSYPAVRDRDVFAQPFFLPPTIEQQRIVAKLDAALAGLERAETAATRAHERLTRYRTAVLDAAVTGELTRKWRDGEHKNKKPRTESGELLLRRLLAARDARREQSDSRLRQSRFKEPTKPQASGLPALPEGWAWASIDQLSWTSGYGTSVKCSYKSNGHPVLRIPNVHNRMLDFGDLKFAAATHDFADDAFIAVGDMLVVRTNGSRDLVGRAAIAMAPPERNCSFASYLIRFRLVGDETVLHWVSLAWDSRVLRSNIEARAVTTAGQYNVSLSRLADLPIPLPPIDEMAEIVREVDLRLSAADALAAKLEEQLARAHETRQALLADALVGRLVSQESNDEPASALLQRVRSARETQGQKPRGKIMKSRSKPKAERRPLLEVLREHKKPITPDQLFREAGFDVSQVDEFYRELSLLREEVTEVKPNKTEVQEWPLHAHVFLRIKEGGEKNEN